MRRLALLLLMAVGCIAGTQSVSFSACSYGTNCPSVTLPSTAPFTSAGANSNRIVLRVHGFSGTLPTTVANLGVFRVLAGGGNLSITNTLNPPAADTLSGGGGPVSYSGMTDIEISLQRDPAGAAIPTGLSATNLTYFPGTTNWVLTVTPVQTQSPNGTQTPVGSSTWAQITTVGTQTSWAGLNIGLNSGLSYAWLRWYSTVSATSNSIPDSGSTGDVADWEFEGSIVDSVHSLTFTVPVGSPSYGTTPTYAPSCVAGQPQSFAVGTTGTLSALNSESLNGTSTLTYSWAYAGAGTDGVTQSSLAIGSPASALTTLTGYTKGSVNMTVTVTDTSSQSTSCTIHDGAVNVGFHDVVVSGLGNLANAILGNMLRWGSTWNREPWFDKQNKAIMDVQFNNLTSNGFINYWDTFQTGTVNVSATQTCGTTGTSTTSVAVGTGTLTFTTQSGLPYVPGDIMRAYFTSGSSNFVQGPIASYSGTTMVLNSQTTGGSGTYTAWTIEVAPGFGLIGAGTSFTSVVTAGDNIVIAWNAGNNRFMTTAVSAVSNTCIAMLYPYQPSTTVGGTPATETGLSWGDASIGPGWSWGVAQAQAPGNYYDSFVKAPRLFYERTGIDIYWSDYITGFNLFWRQPPVDEGYAFYSTTAGNNNIAYTGRSISFEGLLLRATDAGMSGLWNNFVGIFADDEYNVTTILSTYGQALMDQREQGYTLSRLGYCVQYDPNPTVASGCQTALATALPLINNGVSPDGALLSYELSNFDTGVLSPTTQITVSHLSTTITCSACQWTTNTWTGFDPAVATNSAFVTFPVGAIPANNSGAWSSVYFPSYFSATQATLDRPYSEASSGPSNQLTYAVSNYPTPGYGSEPFLTGIQTTGLFQDGIAMQSVDPTHAALANALGQGNASWLWVKGYSDPAHSGQGGITYYADFLTCSYPVQSTICLNGGTANTQRGLTTEAIRGLLFSYNAAPNITTRARIQTWLDQAFCTQGYTGNGCTSDGLYWSDLADSGGYLTSSAINNKYLGQCCGWSGITNALAMLASNNPPVPFKVSPVGGQRSIGGIKMAVRKALEQFKGRL